MYNHILLATELLEESTVIEDRAAFLQKVTAAKLSIIHVVEPMPVVYPVGESTIAYNFQETIDHLTKNAKESIESLKERLGVDNAETHVKQGLIGDEILKLAEENDVDLIITGSHGRHGIRLLLGSTANTILHGAKVDVMAVRIK